METKRIVGKDFTLNLYKTSKFKTTRIHVTFGNKLDNDTAPHRALVPYLLRAVSKQYDTRSKMALHLENMYASQFNVGVSKVGLTHFITFDMSIINDFFTIGNEPLMKEALSFLKEIIFNPNFNNDIFLEEKRLVEEYFLGEYANKMRFTIKNLIDTMFKDEAYAINPLGSLETVREVSLEDCIKAYRSMILEDVVTVSVVGDIDFDEVESLTKELSILPDRDFKPVLFEANTKDQEDVKNIIIKQTVEQAKMALGYRLDIRYLDKMYYPAIVFNTLLGGSSESLLFHKIREEDGLVYFINSSYDYFKGSLFIYSGINASDYGQVQDKIVEVLNTIKDQSYTDDDLEIAKSSIVSGMVESLDSNYSLALRMNRASLFEREIDIENAKEQILSVTKEQIKTVASMLQLDTTVLLRDDNNE